MKRLGTAMRTTWGAVVLATVACMAAAAPAVALPAPTDVMVEGGEGSWHARPAFSISWTNPSGDRWYDIAAVHYGVSDPSGTTVVGPARIPWAATRLDDLRVPAVPAAYRAQVWLEDTEGKVGPRASALLRFDDERPGDVTPPATSAWLGRTAFPLRVPLSHPSGSPLSGIRGYAASVSSSPGRWPCAEPDRCAEAETDLRGGIGDDTFLVHDLPEGTSYLQAVAVSGSGMASRQPGIGALRVDKTVPDTRLSGVPAGWVDRAVVLTATAADGGSGMRPEPGSPAPFTAISVDGAAPTVGSGASVEATVLTEGIHRIAHYARDLAGNVNDGGSSNGIPNPPPAVAVVRIDRTPPRVAFASAQDPADPELIRASVDDRLSGADPGRGWIGVRRAGSADAFLPLPGAPAPPGELRARWDSDAHPNGEYEFRVVGFDAAGNEAASKLRADGRPMVLASPLKEATRLEIELAGRREPGVRTDRKGRAGRKGRGSVLPNNPGTVPYGRGGRLSGRLAAGGRPLASMPVQIVERFEGHVEPPVRVSTVLTGPDGAFAMRLVPGPSREVTASFAGTPTLSRTASAAIALRTRAAVSLGASARTATVGGAPLVLAGRVRAAAGTIPAEGKAVQLQYRLPGLPWTEFRTVQSDRRGRFRLRYRFSDDDSRGVRFLFRAYAPAQGGWPYEPAGSKPLAVRGR